MKLSRNIYIVLIIIVNIALDQITKALTRLYVVPGSKTPIIGNIFTLHNVENTGAFLGMGSDLNPTLRFAILLALPLLVLGYVTIHVFKNKALDKLSLIGFCCIVGGGVANVYDRIVYGSVTDFFHIDLGGVFRTGIFNFADMSVMLGLGLLLFASFKEGRKNKSA